MNTRITTLIFDCFGVICQPALSGWYNENRVKKGYVDENLQAVLRRFDLGLLSEDDIADYFLKYEGVASTRQKIQEEIDAHLKIDESLVKIIQKMKQKGFKIVLLSNANNAFFERKLYPEYPEFKSLFDEVIISSVVGMAKPDPEIYVHALDVIGSKPEESLFIDDNAVNVDAARALGINGFLYTDSDSFSKHVAGIGVDLDS